MVSMREHYIGRRIGFSPQVSLSFQYVPQLRSLLFSLLAANNKTMSSAVTNPPDRDPAKAAETLPGDYFQFVLAAFKVSKEERFALKDVSQMLAMYWRELNDLVVRVGWEGLIKAEGEGWYSFTPFGLEVAKHV